MAEQNFPDNSLYEMDNLHVLRGMNSETVDLIATDPPFNTGRNRSGTAGQYVDNWKWGSTEVLPDQWKWNEVHPIWLEQIQDDNRALYEVIQAARHCHDEGIAAFLCFLSVRLLEMHRILKPSGSLYLHCDHTANGYIRMALDAIFGYQNFRNEIVWKRTFSKGLSARQFARNHDTIFFYAKSRTWTWNPLYDPYSLEHLENCKEDEFGKFTDENLSGGRPGGKEAYLPFRGANPPEGRAWAPPTRDTFPALLAQQLPSNYEELDALAKCHALDSTGLIYWTSKGNPRYKHYLSQKKGVLAGDVVTNIPPASKKERTGSPDQKPLALYERIISANSQEGDLVCDPFAGCATTIIAARNLNRRWIGIDRRPDARFHVVCRMLGITKKKAEKIRERPDLQEWMNVQIAKYDAHYRTEAPVRTDTGQTAAPVLQAVFPVNERSNLTHAQMHEILVKNVGAICWGCGFDFGDLPHGSRHLELDHVNPKSAGGSDHLDNRALLCSPCNKDKRNDWTLIKLRKESMGREWRKHPIDLQVAGEWARQYLRQGVPRDGYQPNLMGV